MAKQQQIVVTDLTPDSNEMGLVVRPIGGTGGGDVTIIAPLPLPVAITEPIGSNVAADSVSVTLATDEDPIDVNIVSPNPLPVTASFVPIISTNSGLLDGNGDEVVLELNGASGASALFPDTPNDFNGTVVFETSSNGGVEYNEVQANSKPSWEASNPVLADVQPSNSQWIFCLSGGETHIKVRVTSYVSGSVTVTLTGTAVNSDPVQNATFAGGGGNRPVACVLIGGRVGVSNDARPVSIASDNDVANDQAFVVRDMAGTRRVGAAMTGANDFGKAIGGIDDTDVFQFAEIRDTDPVGNENGVIVRNATGFKTDGDAANKTGYMLSAYDDVDLVARNLRITKNDPLSNDYGLIVRNQPGDTIQDVLEPTISASATLGSLNAQVLITPGGRGNVGFRISGGSLDATLIFEYSYDGSQWSTGWARELNNVAADIFVQSFLVSSGKSRFNIITNSAGLFYRVRVSAYTSGSGTGILVASSIKNDYQLSDIQETQTPQFLTVIGGVNDSGVGVIAKFKTSNPTGTEYGLIVRNIPSGTQPVSGTVSTKTDLTPASPAAASVGVASAQAVAANATRKGLDLINVSNARISLGFGATAVLDSGVTLYPGGSFSMDDYSFDLGAVNAIASAAASPLAIQEYNT